LTSGSYHLITSGLLTICFHKKQSSFTSVSLVPLVLYQS
jgi:hypothetical protein